MAAGAFIRLTFDSDYRKDQDGCGAFTLRAIHYCAQPLRCRKFNDGGHTKLS
jgi:hypothetical protein